MGLFFNAAGTPGIGGRSRTIRPDLAGLATRPREVARGALRRLTTPRSRASYHGLSPYELEEALDTAQIEVHYQPKVACAGSRLVGLEALARWRHPVQGLLDAPRFVPMAQRSGLMPSLSLCIARQAFAQVSAWRRQGLATSLALNLPTAAIEDMDLPEMLTRCAESADLSPHWVVLEFDEQQLDDFTDAFGVLSRFRASGFRLAVDHFGLPGRDGKLGLLRRLDFGELKLDRSLVCGATVDSEQESLLADAVRLGHLVGMRVTASGVETRAEWQTVQKLGCDAAQGHYVERALPADAVLAWRKRWAESPKALTDSPPRPVVALAS